MPYEPAVMAPWVQSFAIEMGHEIGFHAQLEDFPASAGS